MGIGSEFLRARLSGVPPWERDGPSSGQERHSDSSVKGFSLSSVAASVTYRSSDELLSL